MKNKIDSLIYIVATLAILFLFVTRYIFVGMGIVSGLLLLTAINKRGIHIPKFILFFLLFIFINIVQYMFFFNDSCIVEVERNIIYISVILLLYNIDIEYDLMLNLWRFMLIFCFAVQIIQFFNLYDINNVLVRFYGESDFLRLTTYESIASFRSGSIFMSINPYFKFTSVCAALFFYDLTREKNNRTLNYFFIAIAFISSLLIGSRTGFLILATIFAVYLISNIGTKFNARGALTFIGLGFVMTLLIIYLLSKYQIGEARFFQTQQTSSFDYKIQMIQLFLDKASWREFIFGMGAYEENSGLFMDSDVGYVLSYYGLVGIIVYYIMIFMLVYFKKQLGKFDKALSIMFFLIIVLGGITSGVYFNYRVFSIILTAVIPFGALINQSQTRGEKTYFNVGGELYDRKKC